MLDPSGLVKGWAVERAAAALAGLGGVDWLVNAGGDVLGRGHARAGLAGRRRGPARPHAGCSASCRCGTGAVATSGTAARGRHLLDPRTGRPVPDHLLSATVVGPSLTWADVLATAAFVEGPAALDRVAALPGYEALLVLARRPAHGDGRAARFRRRRAGRRVSARATCADGVVRRRPAPVASGRQQRRPGPARVRAAGRR